MKQDTPPRASRASIESLYPFRISSGTPPGFLFDQELEADEAVCLLKVFRLLLAWCRDAEALNRSHGRSRLYSWRSAVEAYPLPSELWYPLVAIAQQLQEPASADVHLLSLACLAISDWAISREAPETALLFGETAAEISAANPRFAWVAGKLFRGRAKPREAEYWLYRAVHVAAAIRDRRAHALGLNSLGNLCRQRGSFALAQRHLVRARALAKRYRLPDLEGEVLHDLALLFTFMGDYREAEKHAALAFERYAPAHPNLPKLSHDTALIWAEQGFFARALAVYRVLLPHFHAADERLRVIAATIRCAGASGEGATVERYWEEAWMLAGRPDSAEVRASTLLDMGRGAAGLGLWQRAEEALHWARRAAVERGEHDTSAAVEASLDLVRRQQTLDLSPRRPGERQDIERFAARLVSGLARLHDQDVVPGEDDGSA
ncbi:MAG TPA: tetratricopeptide repeat protein [Longimicrobium sp.]|nr:tetratricopeptide repeat protein [Longimicrobium sp.]